MKTVCHVLGLARSNLQVRAHRPADWFGRRCGRNPQDDGDLRAELRAVIDPLPSYGYRRACELLNRQRRRGSRPAINHKRVYSVMRQAGWLLARHTGRPIDMRAHDSKIAVEQSNRRWYSDGFENG
jgi:hypothetical protein